MASLEQEVAQTLRAKGFDLQDTSYQALIQRDDLTRLRDIKDIPACESSKILTSFPKYLAVHPKITPEKGVFFVILSESGPQVSAETKAIYEKYFPERVVLCAKSNGPEPVARWFQSTDAA